MKRIHRCSPFTSLEENIMKKLALLCCLLSLVLGGCAALSPTTPLVVVVTATNPPPTIEIIPTATNTPIPPTAVPSPTYTITPYVAPVTVAQLESALIKAGYSRYPFSAPIRKGEAYIYVKENVFEEIYVYKDGFVRLEILDAPSVETRAQHMETKLQVLDKVFPADFMSELRKANDAYNKTASSSISTNCPQTWALHDEWNTKYAQCDVSSTTIGSYPVSFALWFYQVTCPSYADFCWFPDFPGQFFIGDNSFTFYDIELTINP
jgi:hypothetical protein